MIHHHIQTLNSTLTGLLPTRCDEPVWNADIHGLGKMVWSNADSNRMMHDQANNFIVRDDKYDLQTCHTIDRIRKQKVEIGNISVYTIECSWLGIGTTKTAGLLAMSVFEQIEGFNIQATDFDNNTERVLSAYWGVNRDKWGQNPEYNAWRISYNYTLPSLDRDDLLFLEGLRNLD